jgi:hypothetical protein
VTRSNNCSLLWLSAAILMLVAAGFLTFMLLVNPAARIPPAQDDRAAASAAR